MPELPIHQPKMVLDFLNKESKQLIFEKINEGLQNDISETSILSELYPETEYVGQGSETLVIGHPRSDEKVVAFHIFSDELKSNPIYALELYHMHRILHILFPHNFPHFFSVVGGENPQSMRKKVVPSPDTPILFPFNTVVEQCTRIGFPVQIDESPFNFAISSDGGEYYLDTIMLPIDHLFFDGFNKTVFEEYMIATGIDSKSQKRALNSLNKLRELQIISTIEFVLTNFNSLTSKGYNLSDLSWLDDLLTLPSISSEHVNNKSIGRIKRFVELMNLPENDSQVREKILTYLSNKQSSA